MKKEKKKNINRNKDNHKQTSMEYGAELLNIKKKNIYIYI